MSLPENLTYITVTGSISDPSAIIVFRTPVWLIGDPVVPRFARAAVIDVDGNFTVELPATDDAEWAPAGWEYEVVISSGGQVLGGSLAVPAASPGGTLAFDAAFQPDQAAEQSGTSYLLLSARGAAGGVAALSADGQVIDAAGNVGATRSADLRNLTAGETVISRDASFSEVGLDLGTLHLSYFTALKTETITSVATSLLGNVGATNTLARIGIYSVAADDSLTTLLASTPSDTALWSAGAYTLRTKALSSSFAKVAGSRYAVGALVLGGTPPQLIGLFPSASFNNVSPRLNAAVTGLSNLPASVALGSIIEDYRKVQFALIP